jgi:hypothetical protein
VFHIFLNKVLQNQERKIDTTVNIKAILIPTETVGYKPNNGKI